MFVVVRAEKWKRLVKALRKYNSKYFLLQNYFGRFYPTFRPRLRTAPKDRRNIKFFTKNFQTERAEMPQFSRCVAKW
jgi:hypothetical protein